VEEVKEKFWRRSIKVRQQIAVGLLNNRLIDRRCMGAVWSSFFGSFVASLVRRINHRFFLYGSWSVVHFGFVIGMELFFLIGIGFHRIKGILSRSLSGAELFFFVMWPIPSLSPLAC